MGHLGGAGGDRPLIMPDKCAHAPPAKKKPPTCNTIEPKLHYGTYWRGDERATAPGL